MQSGTHLLEGFTCSPLQELPWLSKAGLKQTGRWPEEAGAILFHLFLPRPNQGRTKPMVWLLEPGSQGNGSPVRGQAKGGEPHCGHRTLPRCPVPHTHTKDCRQNLSGEPQRKRKGSSKPPPPAQCLPGSLPECQRPRNHVSSSQRGAASLSAWASWGASMPGHLGIRNKRSPR